MAQADNCSRSLEYILDGSAGDLPQPATSYRNLLNACLQALTLSNVKDAYVLKDGGIAVIPKSEAVATTATTLAQFCESFPRGTLRFVSKREMRNGASIGLIVSLSSGGFTSCREIHGGR